MATIMVDVHKRSKGVSDEVDFWHGENIDHTEKKALNSQFHGEIGLLK